MPTCLWPVQPTLATLSHLSLVSPAHTIHAGTPAVGFAARELCEYLAGTHVLPVAPDKPAWEGRDAM